MPTCFRLGLGLGFRGTRGGGGAGNDLQTTDWITREQAAGYTPTAQEIAAANSYMTAIRLAGLRTKIRYRNLLATGGGATSALIPLIDDDSTVPSPITPVPVNLVSPTDYTGAGVVGDGSTKYINLGFNASAKGYTADNIHLMSAARNQLIVSGTSRCLLAANDTAGVPILMLRHHEGASDLLKFYAQGSGSTNGPSNANLVADLVVHGSSIGTTDARVFAAGAQVGATYATVRTTGLPTSNLYALARDNNAVAAEWSAATMAAFGWGLGLTTADVTADYTALRDALVFVGRTGF